MMRTCSGSLPPPRAPPVATPSQPKGHAWRALERRDALCLLLLLRLRQLQLLRQLRRFLARRRHVGVGALRAGHAGKLL